MVLMTNGIQRRLLKERNLNYRSEYDIAQTFKTYVRPFQPCKMYRCWKVRFVHVTGTEEPPVVRLSIPCCKLSRNAILQKFVIAADLIWTPGNL